MIYQFVYSLLVCVLCRAATTIRKHSDEADAFADSNFETVKDETSIFAESSRRTEDTPMGESVRRLLETEKLGERSSRDSWSDSNIAVNPNQLFTEHIGVAADQEDLEEVLALLETDELQMIKRDLDMEKNAYIRLRFPNSQPRPNNVWQEGLWDNPFWKEYRAARNQLRGAQRLLNARVRNVTLSLQLLEASTDWGLLRKLRTSEVLLLDRIRTLRLRLYNIQEKLQSLSRNATFPNGLRFLFWGPDNTVI